MYRKVASLVECIQLVWLVATLSVYMSTYLGQHSGTYPFNGYSYYVAGAVVAAAAAAAAVAVEAAVEW